MAEDVKIWVGISSSFLLWHGKSYSWVEENAVGFHSTESLVCGVECYKNKLEQIYAFLTVKKSQKHAQGLMSSCLGIVNIFLKNWVWQTGEDMQAVGFQHFWNLIFISGPSIFFYVHMHKYPWRQSSHCKVVPDFDRLEV